MQHIYTINPVEMQPQNDNAPGLVRHPRGRRFLAAAFLSSGFVLAVDILYAAWVIGGSL